MNIARGKFVCEYVGEYITTPEASRCAFGALTVVLEKIAVDFTCLISNPSRRLKDYDKLTADLMLDNDEDDVLGVDSLGVDSIGVDQQGHPGSQEALAYRGCRLPQEGDDLPYDHGTGDHSALVRRRRRRRWGGHALMVRS